MIEWNENPIVAEIVTSEALDLPTNIQETFLLGYIEDENLEQVKKYPHLFDRESVLNKAKLCNNINIVTYIFDKTNYYCSKLHLTEVVQTMKGNTPMYKRYISSNSDVCHYLVEKGLELNDDAFSGFVTLKFYDLVEYYLTNCRVASFPCNISLVSLRDADEKTISILKKYNIRIYKHDVYNNRFVLAEMVKNKNNTTLFYLIQNHMVVLREICWDKPYKELKYLANKYGNHELYSYVTNSVTRNVDKSAEADCCTIY